MPASLKVILTALAVMDDLGAIIVIAVFYTAELAAVYLLAALGLFGSMLVMNRVLRIMALLPYLAGGVVMWHFMLKSGVHATIAGVLLAFAIPYSAKQDDEESPAHKLENLLHKPVAFLILAIFALANTGIMIGSDWAQELASANSLGITLLVFAAVSLGICRLPLDLIWKHVFGAGLLGGIGFTMPIFITNLAFTGEAAAINASRMAILLASLTAGTIDFVWLKLLGQPALRIPIRILSTSARREHKAASQPETLKGDGNVKGLLWFAFSSPWNAFVCPILSPSAVAKRRTLSQYDSKRPVAFLRSGRLLRLVCCKEMLELVQRHRLTEIIALHFVACMVAQEGKLLHTTDALSHDF